MLETTNPILTLAQTKLATRLATLHGEKKCSLDQEIDITAACRIVNLHIQVLSAPYDIPSPWLKAPRFGLSTVHKNRGMLLLTKLYPKFGSTVPLQDASGKTLENPKDILHEYANSRQDLWTKLTSQDKILATKIMHTYVDAHVKDQQVICDIPSLAIIVVLILKAGGGFCRSRWGPM